VENGKNTVVHTVVRTNGNIEDHEQLIVIANPTKPQPPAKKTQRAKAVATKAAATAVVTKAVARKDTMETIPCLIMLGFPYGIVLKTKMVANACAAAAIISLMSTLASAKKSSSETK
jgi:hypothetical protein